MTQSLSPWNASGMAEANQPLEAPVTAFLDKVLANPEWHGRFLNTVSMLEHRGSRKIMLTQMDRVLTQETLKHLAEEARHAFFFKRQAERIAGHALDGYEEHNTLARFSALTYFARLDAGISREVPDEHAYPWVSLIVEYRACWMFGRYEAALKRTNIKIPMKSIIAEEDGHLEEMFEQCGADYDLVKKLCAYETKLFNRFWTVLEASIDEPLKEAA